MRLALLLALAACSSSGKPGTIEIHTPDKLAFGTQRATNDLVSALSEITGRDITMGGLGGSCRAGELHVVVRGHELPNDLAVQAYSIQETRCADDGHYIEIEGGSLLAAQWGIYDFLERVGVRFFHPEQTLYPEALRWPAEPIRVVETPAFSRRGIQAHRTHPIELSPPLAGGVDMAGIQKRWMERARPSSNRMCTPRRACTRGSSMLSTTRARFITRTRSRSSTGGSSSRAAPSRSRRQPARR